MCHLCGDSRKVPQRCPSCSDPSFKYSGLGTQRVESVVKACFPQENVQRMGADRVRLAGSPDLLDLRHTGPDESDWTITRLGPAEA